VDNTVEFIRANSPRLSMLLFDFIRQAAVDDPKRHYGAEQTARNVAKLGEPRGGFAIDDKKLVEWLTDRGLSLVQHVTPRQLQQFARKSTGAYLGKVTGYLDHCVAQVEGTPEQARVAMQIINATAGRSPQQVVAISDDIRAKAAAAANNQSSSDDTNGSATTSSSKSTKKSTPAPAPSTVTPAATATPSPSSPSSSSSAPTAAAMSRAAKKKGKK
jgi:hypothetical protein